MFTTSMIDHDLRRRIAHLGLFAVALLLVCAGRPASALAVTLDDSADFGLSTQEPPEDDEEGGDDEGSEEEDPDAEAESDEDQQGDDSESEGEDDEAASGDDDDDEGQVEDDEGEGDDDKGEEEDKGINDGLTAEERELIKKKITELTPEEKRRRTAAIRKMQANLQRSLKDQPKAPARRTAPLKPKTAVPRTTAPKTTDPKTARPKPKTQQPKRQVPKQTPKPKQTPQRGRQTPQQQELDEEEEPQQQSGRRTPPQGEQPPRGGADNARNQPPAPAADDQASKQEPTPVELPQIPDSNFELPWNKRKYAFTLQGGNYRELVEGFALQTGLPLLNAAESLNQDVDGEVSYSSLENMDFYTALSELNDLLYRQINPALYLYLRQDPDTGNRMELYAIREWRKQIPDDRVFMELSDVYTAGLRGSDIIRVFFTPESGAEMRAFNEMVVNALDDITLVDLNELGYIDFYGRLDQLNKMLDQMDKFKDIFGSGENIERIPVEYILPSEAVIMLQSIVEGVVTEAAEGTRPGRGRRGSRSNKANEEIIDSAKVLVIADDEHKSLLVQGLSYKVNEVKEGLALIDIPDSLPPLPENIKVVRLEHADPVEAAELLEEVINGPKVSVRRGKKGKSKVEVDTAEDIQITPNERNGTLFLAGNEELMAFAVTFLKQYIDVPVDERSSFRRVKIEHLDVDELATLLESVIGDGGGKSRGKGKDKKGGGEFRVQPAGDVLILVGDPEQMDKAESLIAELDVAEDKPSLFIAVLERAEPEFVVDILESQGGGERRPKGNKPGKARGSTSAGSFFADEGKVYFYGTQSAWDNEVLPIIKKIDDSAVTDVSGGEIIPLEYIGAGDVINVLESMFGGGGGPGPGRKKKEGGLQFFEAPNGLLVVGSPTRAEINTIHETVELLDVDTVQPELTRFYPIKHADPSEVQTAIEAMFAGDKGAGGAGGGSASAKKRRRKGRTSTVSDDLRIVSTEGGLIIFTIDDNFQKIEELIALMDTPTSGDQVVLRRLPVKYIDVYELEEHLYVLLEAKMLEAGGEENKREARDKLNVQPDPRTNTILISAPMSIVEYAESVLPTLDVEPLPKADSVMDIYDCQNALASDLAQILSAIYAADSPIVSMGGKGKGKDKESGNRVRIRRSIAQRAAGGGGGSSDIEIMPLPGDKAISITAPTREQVDDILLRAAEIDDRSVSEERVTRRFVLNYADPDQVCSDLIDMLDERKRTPRNAQDDEFMSLWDEPKIQVGKSMTCLPMWESRTAIVATSPAKMVAAERLIQTFEDMEDPENDEVVPEPFEFFTPRFLTAEACVDNTNRYLDAVYGYPRPVELTSVGSDVVLKGKTRYFQTIKDIMLTRIDTQEMAEVTENAVGFVPLPSGIPANQILELIRNNMSGVELEIEHYQDTRGAQEADLIEEIPVQDPRAFDTDDEETNSEN